MRLSAPVLRGLPLAVLTAAWLNGCGGSAGSANPASAVGSDAAASDPLSHDPGQSAADVGGGVTDPVDGGAAVPFAVGDGGKVYATLPYRGLAMAGAEFGASVGGQFDGTTVGKIPGDYYYPTTDLSNGGPDWPASSSGTEIETDLMVPYYLGKGMNTIRLPLRWERLQRSLSSTSSKVLTPAQVIATFNAPELAALEKSVTTLTAAGFTVLIDIHNYAYYTSASEIAANSGGDPLGSSKVPNVAFENLWVGLASIYANDPKVVFDIMNEPNTPPDPDNKPAGYEWYLGAQAAVTGIRSTGANNLILICGNDFAGPQDFVAAGWSDPLKDIKDPANNFAFEIHDYPDTAFGTADDCTTQTVKTVMDDLTTFVAWAKQYKAHALLGEFSAGISTKAGASCEAAVTQMLTFVAANPTIFIGWTYWGAGAGFGSDNPMNSPLFNPGHDSPQMTVLAPFLK
jgi:endoglucanase